MSVTYRSVAPVLVVQTVEPTLAFFRDRLGFALAQEVRHGDTLGFALVQKDDVVVMIQSHESLLADVGEDSARGINAATSERGAVILYVTVSDVEQVVPVVADADVLVPLRKTFYGMHEITIREPGGHAVTLASELSVT